MKNSKNIKFKSEFREGTGAIFPSSYPAEDDVLGWCEFLRKDWLNGRLFGKAADEIKRLMQIVDTLQSPVKPPISGDSVWCDGEWVEKKNGHN